MEPPPPWNVNGKKNQAPTGDTTHETPVFEGADHPAPTWKPTKEICMERMVPKQ